MRENVESMRREEGNLEIGRNEIQDSTDGLNTNMADTWESADRTEEISRSLG